jgi:hypothetical protein
MTTPSSSSSSSSNHLRFFSILAVFQGLDTMAPVLTLGNGLRLVSTQQTAGLHCVWLLQGYLFCCIVIVDVRHEQESHWFLSACLFVNRLVNMRKPWVPFSFSLRVVCSLSPSSYADLFLSSVCKKFALFSPFWVNPNLIQSSSNKNQSFL